MFRQGKNFLSELDVASLQERRALPFQVKRTESKPSKSCSLHSTTPISRKREHLVYPSLLCRKCTNLALSGLFWGTFCLMVTAQSYSAM
nr:MAG TPA: hypothetical protein [Caudoviricetes sp.]